MLTKKKLYRKRKDKTRPTRFGYIPLCSSHDARLVFPFIVSTKMFPLHHTISMLIVFDYPKKESLNFV